MFLFALGLLEATTTLLKRNEKLCFPSRGFFFTFHILNFNQKRERKREKREGERKKHREREEEKESEHYTSSITHQAGHKKLYNKVNL